MRSRNRLLKVICGALASAVVGCRTACPPSTNESFRLGPVPGPEDFEVQTLGPGAPRFVVSSQDRSGDQQAPGHLLTISLVKEGDATPKPCALTNRGGCSFHPHGLSLVNLPAGGMRLYVINHHDLGDTGDCLRDAEVVRHAGKKKPINSIEVYEPEGDGAWRMRERLLDPLLTRPNDVVALADGTLYVSNPAPTSLGQLYEGLIGHGSSRVVMFDGKSWHLVPGSHRNPNGVAVDEARRRLYVAMTAGRRLDVFALDGLGGATAPVKVGEIPVGSGVDNLSWGPEGPEGRTLWVAAHRSLWAFAKLGLAWQKGSAEKPLSPSEVFKIHLEGDTGTATCVFCDDGRRISAASTAVLFDGNLYMGQVFEGFVLRYPFP